MKKIVLAILSLLVLFAGYVFYKNNFKTHLSFESFGLAKKITPAPELGRPLKINVVLEENVEKLLVEKIHEVESNLKSNDKSIDDWLALGIYRKMAGDYEGAREIWEYASFISPGNITSFNNLGELYAYYLKNNKKAEENYKQAVKNGPASIYIYRNFHFFYKDVLKNNTKAKAVLEQGIAANPGEASLDLQNLLKNY
ncbi:MAG: hypothetical protein L6Q29_01485 [Candidatus Pacebacteria bacterium]|nr:hypothetical protein [Candidatus Paceibacterota bacterium]NUQ57220.1 hypothetical protein [Candidatus Paceibacter sp.]